MIKYSYNKIRRSRALLFRSKLTICIVAVAVFASFFTGCKDSLLRNGMNMVSHEKIKGEVELVSQVHTDEQKGASGTRKTTTIALEERLSLRTKGNVYHPNLLSYAAAIGVGLIQHDYDSTDGDQKTSGMVHEYDFSADILKAKAFPLRLGTSKVESLIPRQFLGALKVVNESSNVIFAIRSQKWPMTFQYSTTSVEQSSMGSTSDSTSSDSSETMQDTFRYGVSHSFASNSFFSFDFQRIERVSKSTNYETNNDEDRYRATHQLNFGNANKYSLGSSLDFTEITNKSSIDTLRWVENLKLAHSRDFSTNYIFRFLESKNALNKNTEADWDAFFTHNLYKSLTTSGGVRFVDSKIGNISENQRQAARLSLAYRKNNRFGSFMSSYHTDIQERQQSGGSGIVAVVGESYFATSEPIVLNHRNIDISTIRLEDKDGFLYKSPSDYTATEVNGRVHLRLFTFVADAPDFVLLDGTKEFFVDYEYLIEPERKEETLNQRFHIRQDFKNGLGLFYSHSTSEQSITSNVATVTPDESTADTYGFDYRKGRLNFFGEYVALDSTQIVSNTKRLRARYSWDLNATISANIHALKEIYSYTFPNTTESSVLRFGGELIAQFNSKLSATTGVNYLEREDSEGSKMTGVQFRSNLKYKYRRISLSTGLNYNTMDSSGTKSDSLFIYVRAKRFF